MDEDALEVDPVPVTLVALTMNAVDDPTVSPVTTAEVLLVMVDDPPEEVVTVYLVMADPPLEAGAVQLTSTIVAPTWDAVTAVGAPGALGRN